MLYEMASSTPRFKVELIPVSPRVERRQELVGNNQIPKTRPPLLKPPNLARDAILTEAPKSNECTSLC